LASAWASPSPGAGTLALVLVRWGEAAGRAELAAAMWLTCEALAGGVTNTVTTGP
jgi:hypothetical protein